MRTLLASLLASSLLALVVPACATDSAELEQEAISVTTASAVRIIRNQGVEVAVTVTDGDVTSPVTISVDNLPAGVTVEPVTIEAGETSAMLTFVAGADIALGTNVEVMIRATADKRMLSSASLGLRLTDKAPSTTPARTR